MLDQDPLLIGAVSLVCLIVGALVFVRSRGPPSVLPLKDFIDVPVLRKENLSHDTIQLTLGLPKGHVLGLPTGQHISFRIMGKDGKPVQRSYTPVTSSIGEVTLVIKVYKANVHPKFPDGGKLSQHMDSLQVGDTIPMKGPKGHVQYLGKGGHFVTKPLGRPREERQSTQYIMIAGGTGITPMLQVLHYIFAHPSSESEVKIKLLFANQTEDDILVRDELEHLAKTYPDRFQLHYTLDRPPTNGWKYSKGFIDKQMLQEHCLFDNSHKNTQVFMCGPPPMIKYACQPNLFELGFTEKEMVVF